MTNARAVVFLMMFAFGCSAPVSRPAVLGSDDPSIGGSVPADAGSSLIDTTTFTGNVGYVEAASTSGAAAYSVAYARFVQTGDPDGCTNTAIAEGCQKSIPPKANPPPLVSAGDITITGGLTGPIDLTAGPTNDYASPPPSATTWWLGGETLHVSGTGAAAGAAAFTVDLIAPPEPAASYPTVDAAGNISTTWSASKVPRMGVLLELKATAKPDLGVVWCIADPAANGAKLPSSVTSVILGSSTKADGQALVVSGITWKVVGSGSTKIVVKLMGAANEFAL